MRHIGNCTLLAIDCYQYGSAVASLQKSMMQCYFEKVIFFTDIQIKLDGIEVIKIESLKSKDDYSHFVCKRLWEYIKTDFVIISQHDSWILDGSQFDERLYNIDYAGALWLESDGLANGNGGMSWRSRKLLEATGKDDFIKATAPEDVAICRVYRSYLEKTYNLKWASDEICEQFSFELREPKQPTFAFHSFFHQPYRPTVILKRSAALGDCIIMEPVMRYYYEQGYNVVLDMPPKFFDLYVQHSFPVKHISQFDKGRIPAKEISLDLAYEVKPRQSYLKSYFEFCGINDYELSRPQLYPLVDEKTKLFKKYACIHIDNRETPHRNVYGIDWQKVQRHLEALGYTVIQVGPNNHEKCGIEINTPSIGFLKFIIAGCDLFVGIDSGPASIAVAYNKPCVLFFGSVNPDYVHPDLTNVEIIQGNCEKAYCWHSETKTAGMPCAFEGTPKSLQCCKSTYEQVVDAINKLHE